MEEKKYKLTDETITYGGRTLYRIEALKDFSDVKKGDKGGFIQKEENLSHDGDCWIYDDAKAFKDSKVFENAKVYEYARVFGNSQVYGHSEIFGNADIFGNSQIYGCSKVYGNSEVGGNSQVYGCSQVYGHSKVYGHSEIFGHSKVYGNAEILCDALIQTKSDYIIFQNTWSSGRFFTWTRSNNMWRVGCFYGTGEELIEKAYQDSFKKGKMYEAYVKFVETTFLNN